VPRAPETAHPCVPVPWQAPACAIKYPSEYLLRRLIRVCVCVCVRAEDEKHDNQHDIIAWSVRVEEMADMRRACLLPASTMPRSAVWSRSKVPSCQMSLLMPSSSSRIRDSACVSAHVTLAKRVHACTYMCMPPATLCTATRRVAKRMCAESIIMSCYEPGSACKSEMSYDQTQEVDWHF
jgi:hypothetical protein